MPEYARVLNHYERNINTSVAKLEDGILLTKSSLLDLNHHMGLSFVIRMEDQEIIKAEAFMNRAPFKVCRETLENVSSAVGLRIERGITKKLGKIIGGSRGCVHLLEVAKEAVILSSNILLGQQLGHDEWIHRELSDEAFMARGSCFLGTPGAHYDRRGEENRR